jgi:hypothetical protein
MDPRQARRHERAVAALDRREEIFGPVLVIIPFDTGEEALETKTVVVSL